MPIPSTVLYLVALLAACPPAAAQLRSDIRAYRCDGREGIQPVMTLGFAAGDLDGDGDLDLVQTSNATSNNHFFVLFNRGNREFDPPVAIRTPTGPTVDVVVTDLDGDGDCDVALLQSSNGFSGRWVLVFLNRGDGSFGRERRTFVGTTNNVDIEAADLDLDGDVDLVTGTWRQGSATVVLLNDGSANFTRTAYTLPAAQTFQQTYHIALGDLDGDGDPDYVQSTTGGIGVRINTGNGALAGTLRSHAGVGGVGLGADIALGDVDNDGDLDVVLGESGGTGFPGAFTVFPNNGSGFFRSPYQVATETSFDHYAMDLVDLDGDGNLDFASTGTRLGGPVWVLATGNGDGTFAPARVFAAVEEPWHMTTADVDGDGARDVLMTGHDTRVIRVHYSDGGRFAAPATLKAEQLATRVAVADIDRDGDQDMVTLYSRQLRSYLNQGDGTFAVISERASGSCFEAIELADLDADGYPDLVFTKNANCPPYNLYTMLNDGDGTFSRRSTWTLGSAGGNEIVVFDRDNDGDNDVIVSEGLGCPSCPGGYRLFFLEGNGDGSFRAPVARIYAKEPGVVLVAGDFDEDGYTDFAGGTAQGVAVHLNQRNGTFATPRHFGGDVVHWPAVGDLDGDGHLDIGANGGRSGTVGLYNIVQVLLGAGDGTFTVTDQEIGATSQFKEQHGCVIFDANGDGNLDVAVGTGPGCDLALFAGNGDGTIDPMRRYGVDGKSWHPRTAEFTGDGRADLAMITTQALPIGNARVTVLAGGPAPGQWHDLGYALAGTNGPPHLLGQGALASRQSWGATLTSALASSPSALVLGFTRAQIPLFGGVLVPSLDVAVPMGTDPTGVARLSLVAPGNLPGGVAGYFQWWVLDGAGPQGFAASNAVATMTR